VNEDVLVRALVGRSTVKLLELEGQRGRESDRADAVLRLRVGDAQNAVEQIDVPPAQREKLRAADAGQNQREEDGPVLGVSEGLGDPCNLRWFEIRSKLVRTGNACGTVCRGTACAEGYEVR
jgi:hypothetical protein